jgi:SNF2 family DNA or RNA helicase
VRPSESLKFSRPLWKHQAECLDRFAYESEAALLHEMGTGKTTTAIAWLRAKYNVARGVLPTLIVSPKVSLENWLDEIKRNAPEKVFNSATILHGSEKRRVEQLRFGESEIFVVNPEAFDMKELVEVMARKRFEIVLIDEVHRFKNPKSKRLDNLLTVSDAASCRMIMTGTPILNSYLDIWAQWRILDKGATFGPNFFVFRNTYFFDSNIAWKGRPKYFPHYVPKTGIEPQISAMIERKASRKKKAECLDLPPLLRLIEHVELSAEQRSAYLQMESELIAEVKAGVCVATNALVRVLRMLQILSGHIHLESSTGEKFSHKLKENPRMARLKELLEDITPTAKVIVWCNFKENYSSIRDVCENLGVEYAEIHGEKGQHRTEEQRFQNDPKCRVMIANPQAGGVAINLTAASYAIYYSRGYSLGDRLQSEARCHRGGSEIHSKITLIDLVAPGTLDEAVLAALLRKETFSESVLAQLRARYNVSAPQKELAQALAR